MLDVSPSTSSIHGILTVLGEVCHSGGFPRARDSCSELKCELEFTRVSGDKSSRTAQTEKEQQVQSGAQEMQHSKQFKVLNSG